MTSRPRRPPARHVAAGTLALFLAVFALLAFQLRSGRDPALGGVVVAAKAPAVPPKRVLIRKVVITRVVVHLPRDGGGAAAPVRAITPASPAPAAPVQVAPAAPAPAPPPLTTRTS